MKGATGWSMEFGVLGRGYGGSIAGGDYESAREFGIPEIRKAEKPMMLVYSEQKAGSIPLEKCLSPHVLGITGEFLNLLGAVGLGFDILLRSPERARRKRLAKLHDFALRAGLERWEHKGVNVSSPDFAEAVSDRRAAVYGGAGVGLLVAGFFLLVLYHLGEM